MFERTRLNCSSELLPVGLKTSKDLYLCRLLEELKTVRLEYYTNTLQKRIIFF